MVISRLLALKIRKVMVHKYARWQRTKTKTITAQHSLVNTGPEVNNDPKIENRRLRDSKEQERRKKNFFSRLLCQDIHSRDHTL